jgi:hypothetical protein
MISRCQNELADIEHHMLHFLNTDNHDNEQRLANKSFYPGSAKNSKPLMVCFQQ